MCTPMIPSRGGRSRTNYPCGKAVKPTERAGGYAVRDRDHADGHADADEDTGD